jgi:hypothetical protein
MLTFALVTATSTVFGTAPSPAGTAAPMAEDGEAGAPAAARVLALPQRRRTCRRESEHGLTPSSTLLLNNLSALGLNFADTLKWFS